MDVFYPIDFTKNLHYSVMLLVTIFGDTMLIRHPLNILNESRTAINQAYRMPELHSVTTLLKEANLTDTEIQSIQTKARSLVETVRAERQKATGIDSFLTEYALSSHEGIALMCLAEALLRVPDKKTIDQLIKDKIAHANWSSHHRQSSSFFVNAATWGLMLTGKILNPETAETTLNKSLMAFLNRSSEGMIRKSVDVAMRIMSKQFVTGRTIEEAIKRAKTKETIGYRYSYDMLGEAALTQDDADRYFKAYEHAITAIGASTNLQTSLYQKPGISIKLSALHPRYQESQRARVLSELTPKLLMLAQLAKQFDIGLTIDAEESERLELSLDVIEAVFTHSSLANWNGFGIAVQSYQKRAFYLLDWIANLARQQKRRMIVRLIKGAYWDSEIKKTQMQGLSDYPVFTRKVFTDVSFQACAKKLLTLTDAIYPQFATHNAYSVAMILELAGDYRDFEFQCLHGMGNELYAQIVPANRYNIPCRIYAPVGSHEDLLPYLVRRLLENGANSSFVNQIVDDQKPIAQLVEDPINKAHHLLNKINQNIPLPSCIFLPERKNSIGVDLTDRNTLVLLQEQLQQQEPFHWNAASILAAPHPIANTLKIAQAVTSPQLHDLVLGEVTEANADEVEWALDQAQKTFHSWKNTTVEERTAIIECFANLLEENMTTLLNMTCFEAGKTWSGGVAEVREAIDYCRYYAAQAKKLMSKPIKLHGYTGETNTLSLHPRGVVLCISPWNFPLAIFTGQILAALVTGNCVIAKPANQTPLIAHFTVQLLLKAGIPAGALQLLLGRGSTIGMTLVKDQRIKAVIFTGSTQTANLINSALAARDGEIIPLIAETGGQNAMIVDSSSLPEQVVTDVITSAFSSAGQRCSALRVLFVQEDIYPRIITLLKGAMAQLTIGDPRWLSTDVGPVIDQNALDVLKNHVDDMKKTYPILYQCSITSDLSTGYFMPPTAIEIDHLQALKQEVFGPVLHVIRFKQNELDDVIAQINHSEYGLTLGIHSRITQTVDYIRQRVKVGNCYVNRNMIGAVVGLQPFGGEGLSGTGPKAGGPFYLPRLCHERTLTIDTTAAGGNASLMTLHED